MADPPYGGSREKRKNEQNENQRESTREAILPKENAGPVNQVVDNPDIEIPGSNLSRRYSRNRYHNR